MVKICIFERSNEKSHFSKTKIYFHKKTTPQLLEHIMLHNMKVGEKTNFGRRATIYQMCSMGAVTSLINFLIEQKFLKSGRQYVKLFLY